MAEDIRDFQSEVAKIQIRAGALNSVGVGFLTTGLAIGATTISIGRLDTFEKLLEYYAYFMLMIALVAIGAVILGGSKKQSDEDLKKLSSPTTVGARNQDREDKVDAEETETKERHESTLSRSSDPWRFWKVKAYPYEY